MKKAIFKFIGLAALTSIMMYNVQYFSTNKNADISLAYLKKTAFALGECSASQTCSNGAHISCSGTVACIAYTTYVECDGVAAYCGG